MERRVSNETILEIYNLDRQTQQKIMELKQQLAKLFKEKKSLEKLCKDKGLSRTLYYKRLAELKL